VHAKNIEKWEKEVLPNIVIGKEVHTLSGDGIER
jgi:hypothetical protein